MPQSPDVRSASLRPLHGVQGELESAARAYCTQQELAVAAFPKLLQASCHGSQSQERFRFQRTWTKAVAESWILVD
eukprot:12885926-Prorocentrum_lima.AAC.1